MEKVKLPREICEVLDSYPFSNDKGTFIWSAMQEKGINENHQLYLVRAYIYANVSKNSISIVNAILHGYEPEETEEERKEREIKRKMIAYVESEKSNCAKTEDYVSKLYDIAHGKK